jgi:hypothetical protein
VGGAVMHRAKRDRVSFGLGAYADISDILDWFKRSKMIGSKGMHHSLPNSNLDPSASSVARLISHSRSFAGSHLQARCDSAHLFYLYMLGC